MNDYNQGDSGGPFVCNEGGRYVLRGAVSWGHSQCRTDHYTVFARVSSFIGWIKMLGNLCISCYTMPNKRRDFLPKKGLLLLVFNYAVMASEP